MQKNEVKLFVCGSMSEGMVHYKKIEAYVSDKTNAFAKGKVFRLPVGYHVFVQDCEAGERVVGELVTLEAPEIFYTLLDEFHGVTPLVPEKGLHFKTQAQVTLSDGEVESAFVYSFNPKKLTKAAVEIDGFLWREDFSQNPPLPTQLTDKQINYIEKLGKSKGREIVPIDLKLYRELMNLDLIVDKGRRLALTKLGKDVFKFLA